MELNLKKYEKELNLNLADIKLENVSVTCKGYYQYAILYPGAWADQRNHQG